MSSLTMPSGVRMSTPELNHNSNAWDWQNVELPFGTIPKRVGHSVSSFGGRGICAGHQNLQLDRLGSFNDPSLCAFPGPHTLLPSLSHMSESSLGSVDIGCHLTASAAARAASANTATSRSVIGRSCGISFSIDFFAA